MSAPNSAHLIARRQTVENARNMNVNGATRILGIIGDPIAQARTPAMANEVLKTRTILGQYVLIPMHVADENLVDFVSSLRAIKNFDGAVVTTPHKVSIASLLDNLEPVALLLGAVNVIRKNADGTLTGTILDGEGFVEGLKAEGYTVEGKVCVLHGAGGAASAIAYSLAQQGCHSLYIVNRTKSKADALSARLRVEFPSTSVYSELPENMPADIAINATSLGMKPGDELPMTTDQIDRADLVAECVIAPEITELLKVADTRGCKVHTGLPMLSAQLGLMLDFMGAN